MIVCKVCGTENEQGASFCGSCGSFLEWNGETVPAEGSQGPAPPPSASTAGGASGSSAPGGGISGSPASGPPLGAAGSVRPPGGPTGPTTDAPTETVPIPTPALPAPAADPNAIICPVCGQENEPTRVYCRRCATELAPAGAATTPVYAEPPRARSLPPVAVLGGVGGVLALGVLAAFVLLPKGAPAASSDVGTSTAPSLVASGAASAPAASQAAASPAGASTAPSAQPSAVPALTGLVVFSAVKNGNEDLWIWDPSDNSVRPLLKDPGNQGDPAWSPDGGTIVYRDPRGLRMVTLAGQPANPPDFTHHSQDRHPAWSPDGKTVVFATNRDSASLDIVTRPANDNQAKLTVLANSKADDWDPQYSPDGSQIVFASKRNNHQFLYLMNVDGSHQVEVPLGPGLYDDPMFSPDGQWLAFTRRSSANSNKVLYVARVDGSEMRRLTHNGDTENDMAWSPDGRTIAVVRDGTSSKIVLVDVATGNDIGSFGVDGADNRAPDWWRPAP